MGDIFSEEQGAITPSAFSAATDIITLRGFDPEEPWYQPPAPAISSLGSTLTLRDGHVTTTIDPARLADLPRELKLRLDEDALKRGAASKLGRKISFATSLLAGRYGRSGPFSLGPIKARQYQKGERQGNSFESSGRPYLVG